MTTKLDAFEPRGIPIHPYDVYALLIDKPNLRSLEHSPSPEDEADYFRNRNKIGEIIEIDGKEYFQTTTVAPKTDLLV